MSRSNPHHAQPPTVSAPVRGGAATVADPDGTQSAPLTFIAATNQPPPKAALARWLDTLERLVVVVPWWQRNAIAISASVVFSTIALAFAIADRLPAAGLLVGTAVALGLTVLIRPDRAINPPQPWWRRMSVIISAVVVLVVLAIFVAVIAAANALEPRLRITPVPPILISDAVRAPRA